MRGGIVLQSGLSRVFPKTLPGSGGSFYYFSRLPGEQKLLYEAIYSGIRSYSNEIEMPMKPINEISEIFSCVLLDNPMIFYTASSFELSTDSHSQRCDFIPKYKFSHSQAKEYAKKIMRCLRVFDSAQNKSDIYKELYVHDFCVNNFSYDYSFSDNSYSILGLVLNKSAVCAGIAKFVKLAFDYLQIKSLVVSGKANSPRPNSGEEGHAWNIVRVGGRTYHLDVTFDMTIKDKITRYDYFNLPDDEIKKDHAITGKVPPCTTAGKDYYSVKSLYVNGMGELDDFIGRALKQGKRHIVVKIKNEPYTKDSASQVIETAKRQYSKNFTSGAAIETSCNSSQMVFEIIFK